MIEFTNRHKNGNFTYTKDELVVEGYFDANDENIIISLNLTYNNNIGTASVYHNIDTDKLNYSINSSNIENITTITLSIGDVYDEIQASLLEENEDVESAE